MPGWRASIQRVLVCGTLLALTAAAHAQSARYVSSGGSDANACTRSAPCLTLQRGVDATPTGGLLQVLDTGAYGSATIVRSITISGDGVSAGVGRITINATTIRVVLRGLLLNGTVGGNGITISAATSVHIVRCEIERFTNGILLSSAGIVELFVTDSIVRNNNFDGLVVTTVAQERPRIVVEGSRFENNGSDGLSISNGQTSISRTIVSGNRAHGIVQLGNASNSAIVNTMVASNSGDGIRQAGGNMDIALTTSSVNGANGYNATSGSMMTATATTATGNVGHGYAASGGFVKIDSSTSSNNVGSGLLVTGAAVVSNSMFTGNFGPGIRNDGTTHTRGNNTIIGNGGGDTAGFALTPLTGK